eukprot:316104-Chlamydomonas_euryale.AAC.1
MHWGGRQAFARLGPGYVGKPQPVVSSERGLHAAPCCVAGWHAALRVWHMGGCLRVCPADLLVDDGDGAELRWRVADDDWEPKVWKVEQGCRCSCKGGGRRCGARPTAAPQLLKAPSPFIAVH